VDTRKIENFIKILDTQF